MSSIFRRISNVAQRAASNIYSGARRAAAAVIPESVRRSVTNFTNWLTGNVEEEQIPQVLNEVVRNVEERLPRRPNFELRQEQSAFRNFTTQQVIDGIRGYGPNDFLEASRQSITRFLRNHRNTKIMLSLLCVLRKSSDPENVIERPLRSHHEINLRGTDADELYDNIVERVMENLDKFMVEGSGWEFDRVITLTLFVTEYAPLWEGLAGSWMPLPERLKNRKRKNNNKGLINIKNTDDNKCFAYCVMRAIHPKKEHPERVDSVLKEQIKELNMDGIEYPVKIKDIDKFEKQNPTITIVVLGYENNEVYPIRNQHTFNREHLVVLLLITNEGGNNHYVLVKNPSALLSSKLSKNGHKNFFCWNCLNHCTSEERLKNHQDYCYNHDSVKVVMPDKGSVIEFKNHIKTQWVYFVIFADFESYIEPINTVSPNPSTSYTKKYQKHEPSGFCFYVKSFYEEVFKSELVQYTGENASVKFVEAIESVVKKIYDLPEKTMVFTEKDQELFNKATKCHICKKILLKKR